MNILLPASEKDCQKSKLSGWGKIWELSVRGSDQLVEA